MSWDRLHVALPQKGSSGDHLVLVVMSAKQRTNVHG